MKATTHKKVPCANITIFGAKGDLTYRKLIPALYNLYIESHLPSNFAIYCVDAIGVDEAEFKDHLLAGVNAFSRNGARSEEHTSELQSHSDLVCRLLLEKKKT